MVLLRRVLGALNRYRTEVTLMLARRASFGKTGVGRASGRVRQRVGSAGDVDPEVMSRRQFLRQGAQRGAEAATERGLTLATHRATRVLAGAPFLSKESAFVGLSTYEVISRLGEEGRPPTDYAKAMLWVLWLRLHQVEHGLRRTWGRVVAS